MSKEVLNTRKIYDLEYIGMACKAFRQAKQIIRSKVAIDTGYSEQLIFKFEQGLINNLSIFLYYIDMGLNFDEIDDYAHRTYIWNRTTKKYERMVAINEPE